MKQSHFNKRQKKRANTHYSMERSAKEVAEKYKRKGLTYHL